MLHSSQYNYFLPYEGDKIIVFNGLTKQFFVISESNSHMLKEVIAEPEEYINRNDFSILMEKLINGGFICDDTVSEKELIARQYFEYVDKDSYLLIILTTYNCNFNCWYCTQSHKEEYLTDDVADRIKKHISRYLVENNIKNFVLSWFGGEPTLRDDKIIDISLFAKEFCMQHGVEFSNGITTNGSLLSDKMIENFLLCDLNRYQITIDGTREMHNKVRYNDTITDSFKVICNNITKIIDLGSDVEITLRYNYTSKNLSLDIIDDLNALLPIEYRTKIEFMPRKVWQEKEEKIDERKLRMLYEKAIKSGYIVNLANDMVNNICYAEKKHFNTIFQNGEVDKCSNLNIGQRRGRLDDNGNIMWEGDLSEYNSQRLPYPEECLECRHLPVCMGLCPVRRRLDIENAAPFKCLFEDPDRSISVNIRNYACEILTQNM